jgi:archaetidylinositol phosphate synthase
VKRTTIAFTAKAEAKLLDYLVTKIPKFITPDTLTVMAFVAAAVGGVAYSFTGRNLSLLHVVNLCVFIHWISDSLDGRLARHIKLPRPNYGFYIDHILDSASAALFLGGLTISPITQTAAWVWILGLMLLAMNHTFLKAKVLDVFEMSFDIVGPTEARLGLVFINVIILLIGNPIFVIFNTNVSLIDLIGWTLVGGFILVLVPDVLKTASELNKQDKDKLNSARAAALRRSSEAS